MPRELRVTATVILPDGTFEEAAALVGCGSPAFLEHK